MRPRVLKQLALTTLREFLRTKEAVFWTYGFPVLMAVVLGAAFSRDEPDPLRVVIVQGDTAASWQQVLAGDPWLHVEVLGEAAARTALGEGHAALVVGGRPTAPELVYDPARADSRFARREVEVSAERAAGGMDRVPVQVDADTGSSRYIDLLIPGLVGLNLMGAGMWGIGFNVVDMRSRHLLRRLIVAPMQRAEFLVAIVLSRLGLAVADALLIFGFGMVCFGVPQHGSWLSFVVVLGLSAVAFSGLGLAVASRTRTTEGVSGLMNLVMLPQWLLSGTFFDTSHFPAYLQPLVMALPLSHVNVALRAVALDGAGLIDVLPQLGYLVVFSAATVLFALRFFRWT